MNPIKALLTILGLTLIVGCAAPTNNTFKITGEHLITPYYKDLEGWVVNEQQLKDFSSRTWLNPQRGMGDAYSMSLFVNSSVSTVEQREEIDRPGFEACDRFESITLAYPDTAVYPIEYWETHCENDNGTRAKLLHLMLVGEKGLYHIQKSWQGEFSADTVKQWKRRFQSVYLCHTQNDAMPCPNRLDE